MQGTRWFLSLLLQDTAEVELGLLQQGEQVNDQRWGWRSLCVSQNGSYSHLQVCDCLFPAGDRAVLIGLRELSSKPD